MRAFFIWNFVVFGMVIGWVAPVQAQLTFQSPYRLSWEVDAPLAGLSIGLNTTYFILNKKMEPIPEASIMLLDRNDVVKIDRSATHNWSRGAAHASDALLFTSMATPALLLLDPKMRQEWAKIGTISLQTFALTVGVTNLTKTLVKRKRPFMYNEQAPMSYKIEKDAQYSFFSGHTSVTTSMCFMTAKMFTDYNPGHKALPYVWSAAVIVPATTALLRYKAGKHFFTDVLVGYLVGAAVGILVPELHKIGVK